jgi:hypothetical protein
MGTKLAIVSGMKSGFYLFGLVFILGCPSAPEDQTTIEINTSVVLPEPADQISISDAFFSFSELTLISDIDFEGKEVKAEQIVSSQTNTIFSLTKAPPGLYSRVQVRLKKPNPNTELPPEFQGDPLSLLIEGEVQIAGGQLVPFRIEDDKQLKDVNLLLSEAIDLFPGSTAQISVEGEVNQIFSGVSFAEIQPSDLTDGVFLLDLRNQPFLNDHPGAGLIADQISDNIEFVFRTTTNE